MTEKDKPEGIIPFVSMDLDTSPLALKSESGAYRFVVNGSVNNPYEGDYGVVSNIKGNVLCPTTGIIAEDDVIIGGYRDDIYNTYFYFIKGAMPQDNKILRYYSDLNEIQVIIKGENLKFTTKITGVSFTDKFLGYTDFDNQGRFIDVEKGNRTGKLTKASIYFGLLDDGITIFAAGQEYYLDITLPDGTNIGSTLVYTAVPTDENNLVVGAENYAAGVNAALGDYVTATHCGCGEVEIVAIDPYVGTAQWECLLIDATTIIPVGGSGILRVYENIIPDDYQEYNILRAHYAPKVQPDCVYGSNPNVETNFLIGQVFQFAYCYWYKNGIRSTQSPVSLVPLTITDCTGQSNQYSNYIRISFNNDALLKSHSFLSDIEGIELLVRFGNTGDWQTIKILKKCDIGVASNFYDWYNDQILIVTDPFTALKPYEAIPITHKSEENATPANMEGQRAFLGNGLVDYDNLCPDIRISVEEETQAPCSRLYDIYVKLWIRNVYVDDALGPYGNVQIQPVWRDTNKHTNQATFGPNYCVFGGLSTVLGAPFTSGSINGIDDQYQQVLTNGEFYCYLLGTDYRANFVQNHPSNITDYIDFDKGIFNGSTAPQRADIRDACNAGEVFCYAVIKNVPHGKYQIAMPSHWCSPNGDYIQGDYKLNNGRRYQGTSTYVLSTGDYIDATTTGDPKYRSEKTIEITLPYDTSGTSNVPINALSDFILGDLTDIRLGSGSLVYDGYVMDSLNGSQLQNDLYQGLKMERQTIEGQGLCPYGLGGSSAPYLLSTDQNGFFFFSCATPPFANFRSRSALVTMNLFSYTDGKYEGTLRDLELGTASPGHIDLQTWGNTNAKHWIFPKYSPTNEVVPNTITTTVIDQDGNPVQGVLVHSFMCGRSEETDSNGQSAIKIYGFDSQVWTVPPTLEFVVYLGTGVNGCCVNLTASWETIVTTWVSPVYPQNQTYDIGPLSIEIKYSNLVNWWLHGGQWRIGIEYLDAQNRSTTVQWNENMVLSMPFWNENSNKLIPKIEIWNLPPQDPKIISYQLLVTKNNLELKVQTAIDDATYFIYYNTELDNLQTTFAANSATIIHIPLQPIDNFNFQHPNSSVGYVFEEGDFVRFINDESNVYFPDFWQFPIKTAVGNNIVIENVNNLFEIKAGMLIGIYRPQPKEDEPIFYEFGQRWETFVSDGVFYHGQGESYGSIITAQNQTATTPAVLALPRGDIYVHDRVMKTDNFANTYVKFVESVHVSDYYLSNSWSIGRTNTIDIHNKQRIAPNLVLFSNVFRPYTQVNGLCNFNGENYRNLPQFAGEVNSLKFVNGVMLAICQNRLVSLYIGENMIQSAQGAETLSITNAVIGGYNVIETVFKFGGTMHPESVVVIGGYCIWYSYQDGAVIRYASNQPFPISDNGMSRIFRDSLSVNTVEDKIPATYNPKTEEYLIRITTTEFGNEPVILAYNVRQELWKSVYNYHSQWIGSTKRGLIQFDGNSDLWVEGEGNYNTWFGTFHRTFVQIVFNSREEIEKFLNYIKIHAIFESPDAIKWDVNYIEVFKSNGYKQDSRIPKDLFKIRNGLYFSTFLRDESDATKPSPLVNGGVLKGNYAILTLSCAETNKAILKEIIIGYTTGEK